MMNFLGYMVLQNNSKYGYGDTYHGVKSPEMAFAEESFNLIQKQDCFKSRKKAFELLKKLEKIAYEDGIDADFEVVEICK